MLPTTAGIIPNATANSTSAFNFPVTFVTYDPAYGVRAIPAASYAGSLAEASGNIPQNALLTAADAVNTSSPTVNALIFNFAGTQTFTGTATINSGALLFSSGISGTAAGAVISGPTLQLGTGGDAFITTRQNAVASIDSVITGPGSSNNLTISFSNANGAASDVVLGATNTYAGGTIINSTNSNSIVQLGGSTTGNGGYTITPGPSGSFCAGNVSLNDITVALAHSNPFSVANSFTGNGTNFITQVGTSTATLSGNISGTIGVNQNSSSGPLVLSGTDSYTGNTAINAGTLQISGAGELGLGSYSASITDNGTLEYSSSVNQTFAGAVGGTGGLTKDTSTSVLTLSAVNTYTGNTTITAGTVQISGGRAAELRQLCRFDRQQRHTGIQFQPKSEFHRRDERQRRPPEGHQHRYVESLGNKYF